MVTLNEIDIKRILSKIADSKGKPKGSITVDGLFVKYVINPSEKELLIFGSTFNTFRDFEFPFKSPRLLDYRHDRVDAQDIALLIYEEVSGTPIFNTSFYLNKEVTRRLLSELDSFYSRLRAEETCRGYGDQQAKFLNWTNRRFQLPNSFFEKVDRIKKVFHRDLHPLNVLVDTSGNPVQVDVMNNDTNPQGTDLWDYIGFMPREDFIRAIESLEDALDIEEFSLVSIMETLKFSGFFIRNPESSLRKGYRNMLRNGISLCELSPIIRPYQDYLEALFEEYSSFPFSLDEIMHDCMLEYSNRGQNIFLEEGNTPRVISRRTGNLISGQILPNLMHNCFDALAGQKENIFFRTYQQGDKQVLELRNRTNSKIDPDSYVGLGISTKGERRGRGLFLTNLYARALGGRLELINQAGYFTARVYLPLEIRINQDVMDYLSDLP